MKNILRNILSALSPSSSSVMADGGSDPKDMGRKLRDMALKSAPTNFHPTSEFPRIYGVLMDWPVGDQTATIFSLSTGDASLYTTSTFGVIGGIGHEAVRAASKALVRMSDAFFDDAVLVTAYPYPDSGRIRFYLLTFTGIRVIDADKTAVEGGGDRHTPLFAAAQEVLTRLRLTVPPGK